MNAPTPQQRPDNAPVASTPQRPDPIYRGVGRGALADVRNAPQSKLSKTPTQKETTMNAKPSTLNRLADLTASADSALIAVRSARCVDGHGETLPDINMNTLAALASLVEAGRIAAGVLHGLPVGMSTQVDSAKPAHAEEVRQ
jgi:hypothetical protein